MSRYQERPILLGGGGGGGGGGVLNYKFVAKSVLKPSKLFAQLCSIEESFKSFKSRPYLTRHMTGIEKRTLKRVMLCIRFEYNYYKSYGVVNTRIFRPSSIFCMQLIKKSALYLPLLCVISTSTFSSPCKF